MMTRRMLLEVVFQKLLPTQLQKVRERSLEKELQKYQGKVVMRVSFELP
jgi:hypothetical protein